MSRSLFYAVSIVLGLIVGTIVMLASSPARSFGLEQEHVEEASTSVLAPPIPVCPDCRTSLFNVRRTVQ